MRRVKRTIFILVGWALMGLMVYLIVVTKTITPEIWNPYDILDIADVCALLPSHLDNVFSRCDLTLRCSLPPRRRSSRGTGGSP